MSFVRTNYDGLDAAIAEMGAFRRSLQTSILKSSLSKAVQPCVVAFRSVAPKGKGPAVRADGTPRPRLFQTATKRITRYRDGMGYVATIGFRGRADRKWGSDAPHAHLVDRGTTVRFRRVINGKFSWVQFNQAWEQMSLSSQRSATKGGLYERFQNRWWNSLPYATQHHKKRTGAVIARNLVATVYGMTSGTVLGLFRQYMHEKVMSKASRMGTGDVATETVV